MSQSKEYRIMHDAFNTIIMILMFRTVTDTN